MYTALAEVYDLFGEDDFRRRAEYYEGLLPAGGVGADIGCGTGALTLELWRKAHNVYGVDCSADMLRKATERAIKEGAEIKFVLGDAGNIPYTRALDFVTASCDVFNYVKDIKTAFKNIYAALKTEGVFAFDISSEYKLKKILAGNTFSETKDDITYIWQNFLKGNKLFIDFTVFLPCGTSYIKTSETQTQYVRSCEEVTDALKNAGFGKVSVYAFGKKRKPGNTTQRIAFVAKK